MDPLESSKDEEGGSDRRRGTRKRHQRRQTHPKSDCNFAAIQQDPKH